MSQDNAAVAVEQRLVELAPLLASISHSGG